MTTDQKKEIALETLAMLNHQLASDPNALTSSRGSGSSNPERAYVDVVKEIIELTK